MHVDNPLCRLGGPAVSAGHDLKARTPLLVTWVVSLLLGAALSSCSTGTPGARQGSVRSSTTADSFVPTTASSEPVDTLQQVAFETPLVGHGIFEVEPPTGDDCDYVAGQTTDGGAHFKGLGEVTSWACNGLTPSTALVFDGNGDGFSYGPGLFVTHDGGLTWASSPQPGTVAQVAIVGASVWMVESTCPTDQYSSSCPLAILESSDGGRSWHSSPTQPAGFTARTPIPDAQSADGQDWLVPVGPDAAYLLTTPETNQTGAPDQAAFWFTPDGGRSWREGKVLCGIDASSVVLAASSARGLAAVCAGQASAGFQAKSASFSSDGGLSWSVQGPCRANALSELCTASPLSGGYLGQVVSPSDRVALVVGIRGALVVTRDAGVSWQAIRSVGDTNGNPDEIAFVSPTSGLVLGRLKNGPAPVALWHTADGGRTWKSVTPILTFQPRSSEVGGPPG